MSKILPLQYAKILYALTEGLDGRDLDKSLDFFVALLYKNQSLNKLPYIIKEFENYTAKLSGNEKAVIKSARKLSAETIEKIKRNLSLKGTIETKVEEKLLGGVIVEVGNKIFDASLKTQIAKLRQQLI